MTAEVRLTEKRQALDAKCALLACEVLASVMAHKETRAEVRVGNRGGACIPLLFKPLFRGFFLMPIQLIHTSDTCCSQFPLARFLIAVDPLQFLLCAYSCSHTAMPNTCRRGSLTDCAACKERFVKPVGVSTQQTITSDYRGCFLPTSLSPPQLRLHLLLCQNPVAATKRQAKGLSFLVF